MTTLHLPPNITPAAPEGICPNCFATWRARKPRPEALHCHHRNAVARLVLGGWKITHGVGRIALKALQKEGVL